MKINFFAMFLSLLFVTPVFADGISVSIPNGGDLVQGQAPQTGPVKILRKDEIEKSREAKEEDCVTTLVMVDGKKGQPLRNCPGSSMVISAEWAKAIEAQDSLSPFYPEIDFSGMNFHQ